MHPDNKAKLKNHDKHAGHSTEMFLRKFWISLILTIPVVLYADCQSGAERLSGKTASGA